MQIHATRCENVGGLGEHVTCYLWFQFRVAVGMDINPYTHPIPIEKFMGIRGGSTRCGWGLGANGGAWGRSSRVERRWRENRGAEGLGVWRGCPPPHLERGLDRGLCPYPENVSIFELKRRDLVHSETDKTYFDRSGVLIFGQQPSGGIAPSPWIHPRWESPQNTHTHRTPKSSIPIPHTLYLFVRCDVCVCTVLRNVWKVILQYVRN